MSVKTVTPKTAPVKTATIKKTPIKTVTVIGAGVMGANIAAHIANAGYQVHLLDIISKDHADRNYNSKKAVEKLLRQDPAPLMDKKCAANIQCGNLEDDVHVFETSDWIIEAIIEKIAVKQALYAQIEKYAAQTAIISSNTSTLPLSKLIEGRTEAFKTSFFISHFFNPPRYMRLLEIVSHGQSDQEKLRILKEFCDEKLGKTCLESHDQPGFIANRIGIYWIYLSAIAAEKFDLTVEEADAIMGKSLGMPKTGIFGLMDLVGLDLMPPILEGMKSYLPQNDPFMQLPDVPSYILEMIQAGYTGRKGKGGFYRLNAQRQKEAFNLKTHDYTLAQRPEIGVVKKAKYDIKALFQADNKYSQYAEYVIVRLLYYAALVAENVTDSIYSVDRAMKLGFNWKWGPFELIDKIGIDWLKKELEKNNLPQPSLVQHCSSFFYSKQNNHLHYLNFKGNNTPIHRPQGVLLLSDISDQQKPLLENESARLWDINEGVVCFEFISKMNSLDQNSFDLLHQSIELVKKNYKAMVIYNEGSHFSAGANIGMALFAAQAAMWPMIEEFVQTGQKTYHALKYAPFPVVGAPSGIAVGGGCEILLHCDAIQAHAETYMGLVEVGVGLIPAWGGCKEMLIRWMHHPDRPKGPMPAIKKVFELIGRAHVAKSAYEARNCLFLKETDGITMHRDRLLFQAKQKALQLADNYIPPQEKSISLPGKTAEATLNWAVSELCQNGQATEYDGHVASYLARILSGGQTDMSENLTESDLYKLEIDAFMPLVQNEKTLARISHMLETGKPLRN